MRFFWRRTQAGIFVAGIALAFAVLIVLTSSDRFSLPAFFMAIAAAMLVFALAALWQSLRSALGERGVLDVNRATLPERAALTDEKNALLRAIKDIAFENQVGKLSDDEFARLDRAYRHRAKEVLRKLDEDLAPFVERAQKLVDRANEAPAPKKKKTAKKKTSKKAKKQTTPRACPSCGASNASDANFCNKCAASLAPKEQADEPQ